MARSAKMFDVLGCSKRCILKLHTHHPTAIISIHKSSITRYPPRPTTHAHMATGAHHSQNCFMSCCIIIIFLLSVPRCPLSGHQRHVGPFTVTWKCFNDTFTHILPPQAISATWPESRSVLERLRSELDTSLDKLTTRERFLNDQFDRLMQQYRASRGQLGEVQVRGEWWGYEVWCSLVHVGAVQCAVWVGWGRCRCGRAGGEWVHCVGWCSRQ